MKKYRIIYVVLTLLIVLSLMIFHQPIQNWYYDSNSSLNGMFIDGTSGLFFGGLIGLLFGLSYGLFPSLLFMLLFSWCVGVTYSSFVGWAFFLGFFTLFFPFFLRNKKYLYPLY